jgi:phosphoglycerate dehydrogenase-like enzyme
MSAPSHIVIGHHFGNWIVDLLGGVLPDWARVVTMPPSPPFPLDPSVEVLLVLPERAGGAPFPTDGPPPGWPFGVRLIQCLSAGIDEYPAWLFKTGTPAATASGSTAVPMAEFVLASLLACEKMLPDVWIRDAADWKPFPLGALAGKTLGLLGFGAIGRAVAERALPFGMRVITHRRSGGTPDLAGVEGVDFGTLLAQSDHLVVAAPLTAATRHMMNAEAFAHMKSGGHLVNVSRGGLVDQDALVAALDAGTLALATLDVTDPEPLPAGHPLYAHPKVRVSPHTSWAGGPRVAEGIGRILLENLTRFRDGRPVLNPVDPEAGY